MSELRGLDAFIRGHWGADYQVEPDWQEIVEEDEGWQLLASAIKYLKQDWYPDWDVTDPVEELAQCQHLIAKDYTCRMCGAPLSKKNSYCNPRCYRADAEGL